MAFFNTFDQVIAFMESYMNLERRTGDYSVRTYRIDRMTSILKALGNPQCAYKTIHVAGSKGKGSTATLMAKGIEALGFKTGLYLSPHVNDYRERFSLAGRFVDDADLIAAGNALAQGLEGFSFEGQMGCDCITTFELYTSFAFLLFKRLGCDWAVIETGLGGRLDATNILLPQASVLTPIELEHTEILGHTIALIAGEKAKIIKPHVPCFIAYQKQEAREVFAQEAKVQSSKAHFLDTEVAAFEASLDRKDGRVVQKAHVKYSDGYEVDASLSMLGKVQAQNFALAVLTLRSLGIWDEKAGLLAMEQASMPARLSTVSYKGHDIWFDGAHTAVSMANLADFYKELYPHHRGAVIFGSVAGKDHEHMAESIVADFDRIVVARPGTFKKSDPEQLYYLVKSKARKSTKVFLEIEPRQALDRALSLLEEGEPLLVTGSFYMAGAIEAIL
jgi:dihydrofolate synthase/folylpolyglutamate synthase